MLVYVVLDNDRPIGRVEAPAGEPELGRGAGTVLLQRDVGRLWRTRRCPLCLQPSVPPTFRPSDLPKLLSLADFRHLSTVASLPLAGVYLGVSAPSPGAVGFP